MPAEVPDIPAFCAGSDGKGGEKCTGIRIFRFFVLSLFTFPLKFQGLQECIVYGKADLFRLRALRRAVGAPGARSPAGRRGRAGFGFGAAARLRSGRILRGSNFESEVFPAGLCAERSLLFYAQANHADDPIEALAIASDPSERECYPCGQCRQVLVDVERRQGTPLRVIMSGGGTASVVSSATLLLPFTFKL